LPGKCANIRPRWLTEHAAGWLGEQPSCRFQQHENRKRNTVKNLLSCTFGKVCTDIPGACIVLQTILVVALASVLGYLFVTQEVLG
jgi:hypothetical protein